MYAKPVIARFTESALRADAVWVRIWICCDVQATVQSVAHYILDEVKSRPQTIVKIVRWRQIVTICANRDIHTCINTVV